MLSIIRRGLIPSLLVGLFANPQAVMATSSWEEITPPGGYVTAFYEGSGSTAYLTSATYTGESSLYVSRDTGASWSLVKKFASAITGFAIDQNNPRHLYISTYNDGVLTSSDSGNTWMSLSFFNFGAQAYAVSTRSDNGNDAFVIYNGNQLYSTTDGGSHWKQVTSFPSLQSPTALVIDKSNPDNMYASGVNGLVKSTDGGKTWSSASIGLNTTGGYSIQPIVVDPTNDNRLFVIDGGSIYESTDAGASWTAFTGGIGVRGGQPFNIAVDPSNPNNLAAIYGDGPPSAAAFYVVYYSTDGGTSWSGLSEPDSTGAPVSGLTVLVDPTNSNRILIGTSNGVYVTTDAGTTWSPSNSGFSGINVDAMALDPKHAGVVYVASEYSGVFRSANSGASWAIKNNAVTDLDVRAIAIDPVNPSVVYAAQSFGDMLVSGDSGDDWTSYSYAVVSGEITGTNELVVDPKNTQNLYAIDYGTGGVISSHDGGKTWGLGKTGLKDPPCIGCLRALTIDPSIPTTLYVGDTQGIYRSTDSGKTWKSISSYSPTTLAIDPTNDHTLFFADDFHNLFMKSTDSGTTWAGISTPKSLGIAYVDCITINPKNHEEILINSETTGVFASKDGGGSWGSMDSGLLPASNGAGFCGSLVFDPTTPNRYYMVIDNSLQTYTGSLPNGVPAASTQTPPASGGSSGSGGGGAEFLPLLGLLCLARRTAKSKRANQGE